MSLVLSFGRPMVVRDIIRRSINSSRTLFLMKTFGNRITQPFYSLPLQSREFSKRVFFRCCNYISLYWYVDATDTEEEKLQKKEKRIEKIQEEKRQLINFGHKFNKMGGTKVVVAYFGLFFCFFSVIVESLLSFSESMGLLRLGWYLPTQSSR